MDKPLRVLHLEDDPDFIALVSALLAREGLAPEMVSVADFQNYVAALKEHSFDIILADYQLPSCNGIQALQAARENCPDVPFLLISGTIGEQVAIESLHCGATDYVLKDRIERLEPAVRRAIQEAREKSQLPLDKKRELSHYSIANPADAGDADRVRVQVKDVFSRIMSKAALRG